METPNSPQRLPDDNVSRKSIPAARGLLDYFPDALMTIAAWSLRGNQKHNPGEDIHWARSKSRDHADCILRHLVDRGLPDPSEDNISHSVPLAWRALALLQEELEAQKGLPISRGSKP